MQKFSEFVEEYKQWKISNGKGEKLSTKEVKKIREAYESLNSRKVPAKKMAEAKKPVTYEEALAKYSEWKKAEHGTGKVTLEERQNLRRALKGEKLVESKKALKESEECKCALCNNDEGVTTVEDYVNDVDTGFEASDILGVMGDDVENGTPVCEACIKDAIYSLGADIEPEEKESFEENKEFAEVVARYREWKKATHKTARLTENEKKLLKEKFFEKAEPKEDPRLTEAVAKYSEWKKAHHNTDKVTESEKKSIAKNLLIDDVKAKITEAKKCLHEARVHMQEGDQMDAAAATMDAGAAINDAAAMGMDPNAVAGDPTAAMASPLPQNIVDEISAIKTSVDALATEAGIESPVDLGADAGAGVPAVTGVEDPNAMPADPNAMPAAPMAESISRVKARLADRESKLEEGLYSNKAMKDGAEEDLVKVPSTKDLIGGTKSGILKAAAVWPTKEIAEPKKSGLKNVEESTSVEAEQAKSVLNEDGNFSWDKFLKLQRGNN